MAENIRGQEKIISPKDGKKTDWETKHRKSRTAQNEGVRINANIPKTQQIKMK